MLLLQRPAAARLHTHVAHTLAGAGYAVLAFDATDDAVLADAALAALRTQAAPERVVVCGAVDDATLVAACATGPADGLVLIDSRLPPRARPKTCWYSISGCV